MLAPGGHARQTQIYFWFIWKGTAQLHSVIYAGGMTLVLKFECAHLIGTFLIDVKFHTKWHIMEFLWLLVKKATIYSSSLCWLTVHITRLSYECHGTSVHTRKIGEFIHTDGQHHLKRNECSCEGSL